MERTHLKAKSAALRMYPRLASKPSLKNSSNARRRSTRPRPKATNTAPDCEPKPISHAALRLRLLKMIVESEKSRRRENHAS